MSLQQKAYHWRGPDALHINAAIHTLLPGKKGKHRLL